MPSSTTNVAEGIKLKDLVTYQNGAVVSRTLLSAEGGTVTAFAFDAGQGLSEHTAPYDAMVIVIEGTVDVEVSGESHHLNEGDMIIMPANKPHALKAMTKFKMILIMVRAKHGD